MGDADTRVCGNDFVKPSRAERETAVAHTTRPIAPSRADVVELQPVIRPRFRVQYPTVMLADEQMRSSDVLPEFADTPKRVPFPTGDWWDDLRSAVRVVDLFVSAEHRIRELHLRDATGD